MSELILDIEYQSWINIICTILALIRWKHLRGADKIIPVLLIINSIADLLAGYMVTINHRSNHIIYYVLWPIENAITLYLFSKVTFSDLYKKIYKLLVLFVLILGTVNIVYLYNFLQITGWFSLFASLLLLITGYPLLRNIIANEGFKKGLPLHWLLIASLIYNLLAVQGFAGSMAMWYYNEVELSRAFFVLNIIAYIAWSVILTTGIYLKNGK